MKRSFIHLSLLLFFLAACGAAVPNEANPSSAGGGAEDTAVSSDVNPPSSTESTTLLNEIDPSKYEDLEIITLLPRDAIPAIDNPQFLSVEEANEFYDPEELIIGVSFDGDSRAYSIPLLSNHEIVNDTVGGRQIAVTW